MERDEEITMKKYYIIILTLIIGGFIGYFLMPKPELETEIVYQIIPITKDDLIEKYNQQQQDKGFEEGYQKREIDRAWEYALNEINLSQYE